MNKMNNEPSFTRILAIVWKMFCAILLIGFLVGIAVLYVASRM
jgi:hypothetical protein